MLHANIRFVGILGLSFKAGKDDLRESPLVHFIKLLIGAGLQIRIWDRDVSLGRLVGSNRQYIEEVIPHVGSLLCPTMEEVILTTDAVVIGSKAACSQELGSLIRPEQTVIDCVDFDRVQRTQGTS